jgi:hypothetical protein
VFSPALEEWLGPVPARERLRAFQKEHGVS